MLIDTMFARDMYQVYEINDNWLNDQNTTDHISKSNNKNTTDYLNNNNNQITIDHLNKLNN